MFLNDLIAKNKEMSAMQEQQKVEIDAQSATLEEQRTHIDMLEKVIVCKFLMEKYIIRIA